MQQDDRLSGHFGSGGPHEVATPHADRPLVITLGLDEHSTAMFDELRRRHFPRHLNRVGAHLTLFHRLPGEHLTTVVADLRAVRPEPFDLQIAQPRLLGRGVAIDATSAKLESLHHQLANRWEHWLTPQDRQPFRPHITIQNKVEPAEARQLHTALRRTDCWPAAQAVGWSVWRYLGGPWAIETDIPF